LVAIFLLFGLTPLVLPKALPGFRRGTGHQSFYPSSGPFLSFQGLVTRKTPLMRAGWTSYKCRRGLLLCPLGPPEELDPPAERGLPGQTFGARERLHPPSIQRAQRKGSPKGETSPSARSLGLTLAAFPRETPFARPASRRNFSRAGHLRAVGKGFLFSKGKGEMGNEKGTLKFFSRVFFSRSGER